MAERVRGGLVLGKAESSAALVGGVASAYNLIMSLNSLDPSREEICRMGSAAVDAMASYLASIRDRRVYPQTTARQIRENLDKELPEEGVDFEDLLQIFREVFLPLSRHNAHPRMFGYVQAPGTAIAALADMLASTLNANLTAWRSAPAPVELERLTINWIKEILGYDGEAAGLFVSGGSMANFAALAAARRITELHRDLARSKGARSLSQNDAHVLFGGNTSFDRQISGSSWNRTGKCAQGRSGREFQDSHR